MSVFLNEFSQKASDILPYTVPVKAIFFRASRSARVCVRGVWCTL